eukprot:CAMPEP_0204304504 /NCGR_PEP_ID=MMETSP0468-20130131/84446_1 /ASSEMBLY_ACC=CAM_ASM_000383 /TAXON_ID=2969 /ORGANISM="Oxyrrhis marina" /LENGTH=557 /DNA_ID=CAMNT_0051283827 /DNA_START=117 /DNA_END=1790 /DNA_ORIENTATION=-
MTGMIWPARQMQTQSVSEVSEKPNLQVEAPHCCSLLHSCPSPGQGSAGQDSNGQLTSVLWHVCLMVTSRFWTEAVCNILEVYQPGLVRAVGAARFTEVLDGSSLQHPGSGKRRLRMATEKASQMLVSPHDNAEHSLVAMFHPEGKSCPGAVQVFKLLSTPGTKPLVTKSFFKAAEVTLRWSPSGRWLLVLVHSAATTGEEADAFMCGRGGHNVYLLDTDSRDDRAQNTSPITTVSIDEMVYDLRWRPGSGVEEFAMLHGSMPAEISLVSTSEGLPRKRLARGPRQRLVWDTFGVSLAATTVGTGAKGALAPDVDIIDCEFGVVRRTVSMASHPGTGMTSVVCLSFSPTGRDLLLASSCTAGVDILATVGYDGSGFEKWTFDNIIGCGWRPQQAGQPPLAARGWAESAVSRRQKVSADVGLRQQVDLHDDKAVLKRIRAIQKKLREIAKLKSSARQELDRLQLRKLEDEQRLSVELMGLEAWYAPTARAKEEELRGAPLYIFDIDIQGVTLHLCYFGQDDVLDLAETFCQERGLSPSIVQPLAAEMTRNLQDAGISQG